MLLTKVFGSIAAAASLAAVILFAMVLVLNAQKEALEQQNAILKDANAENITTIRDLNEFQNDQAKRLEKAGEKREAIEAKTREVSRQLDKLRLDEAQQALAAPFERGNAARDRRERIFLRVAGPESDRGAQDSDHSEAESAGGTASPRP